MYKKVKRRVRHAEKNSDIPRDKMLGRCSRRGWGIGIASVV